MTASEGSQNVVLQPYLFFNGRCDEAIAFYTSALGAEVQMLMRFKDAPPGSQSPDCPPSPGDKVMHASIKIGDAVIMASDGQCGGATHFDGFSLSLSLKDQAKAAKLFHALTEGGKVGMPLGPTFFSPLFGMVEDKFGVDWMIYVPGQ